MALEQMITTGEPGLLARMNRAVGRWVAPVVLTVASVAYAPEVRAEPANAQAPPAAEQQYDQVSAQAPVHPSVLYGDAMVPGHRVLGQTSGAFNGESYTFTLEEVGPTGLQLVARYGDETDTFILGPEVAVVMNYRSQPGERGHFSNVSANDDGTPRLSVLAAGEGGVTIWRYADGPTSRDTESFSLGGGGLPATFAEGNTAIGYLGVDTNGTNDIHYMDRMR